MGSLGKARVVHMADEAARMADDVHHAGARQGPPSAGPVRRIEHARLEVVRERPSAGLRSGCRGSQEEKSEGEGESHAVWPRIGPPLRAWIPRISGT